MPDTSFSPRPAQPDLDPIWSSLRADADKTAQDEPALASFLHATVLAHDTLEHALAFHLSQKLGSEAISALSLRQTVDTAVHGDATVGAAVRADLSAVFERDPACNSYLEPFLYYKGFQAIQAYRVAHWLWGQGRQALAFYLQSRISEVYGVDIHPAAQIGRGIMIDHATSVVVGETAVIEDEVSMLHNVTLGGTGKETGDRHPKIRRGALLGASATVLGNIEVGECSRVGAGSVVLSDVPPHCTVAGVPAKVVRGSNCDQPALSMDHRFVK
ncbi:serine O-acetyltransferase [Thalassobaculum sp.]|uniref:serine O-acetyltransferase n=1 Tax=Thalassobaculum sp. TaxID=2022740 RepID=UPI003B5AE97D